MPKKKGGRPSKIKLRKPKVRQIALMAYAPYSPANVPMSIRRPIAPMGVRRLVNARR